MWCPTKSYILLLIHLNIFCAQQDLESGFASVNQFPYQVLIKKTTVSTGGTAFKYCSGSIINAEWILTTADCINEVESGTVNLFVGANYVSPNGSVDGQAVLVKKLYPHEEFNSYDLTNNLALIYLDTPMVFSASIKSVELASENYIASGTGTVTGWGNAAMPQPALRYNAVNIRTDAECAAYYMKNCTKLDVTVKYNGTTNFCTERPDSVDNGSPITVMNSNGYLQTGIISTNIKCNGTYRYMTLYMDLAKYADWIRETLAPPTTKRSTATTPSSTLKTTTKPSTTTRTTTKPSTTTRTTIKPSTTRISTTVSTRKPLFPNSSPCNNNRNIVKYSLVVILVFKLLNL